MRVVYKNTEKFLLNKKDQIQNTDGNITKAQQYVVYGISQNNESFDYFLFNEHSKFDWFRADLFDIVNHRIPSTWSFKLYTFKENAQIDTGYGYFINLNLVIGYKMLLNLKHYAGLFERNEDDKSIFLVNKKIIDLEELVFMISDLIKGTDEVSQQDLTNMQNAILKSFPDDSNLKSVFENLDLLNDNNDKLKLLEFEIGKIRD